MENKIMKEAEVLKGVINYVYMTLSFIIATMGGISFFYGFFILIKNKSFSEEQFDVFIYLVCGLGIFLMFFNIFLLIGCIKHVFSRIEILESKTKKP